MKILLLFISITLATSLLAQQTCIDFESFTDTTSTSGTAFPGDLMYTKQGVDFYLISGFYNAHSRVIPKNYTNYLNVNSSGNILTVDDGDLLLDFSNINLDHGLRVVEFDLLEYNGLGVIDLFVYSPYSDNYFAFDTLAFDFSQNAASSVVRSSTDINAYIVKTLNSDGSYRVRIEGVFNKIKFGVGTRFAIDNLCFESDYCGYNDLSNNSHPFNLELLTTTFESGDSTGIVIDMWANLNYNDVNWAMLTIESPYVQYPIGSGISYSSDTVYHTFPDSVGTYFISYFGEDYYGCMIQNSFSHPYNVTTSIDEIVGGIISVYPNPSQDYFQIKTTEKIIELDIISLDGKVLMSKFYKENDVVDISNLPIGIYVLRIETEKGISLKQLIKN